MIHVEAIQGHGFQYNNYFIFTARTWIKERCIVESTSQQFIILTFYNYVNASTSHEYKNVNCMLINDIPDKMISTLLA